MDTEGKFEARKSIFLALAVSLLFVLMAGAGGWVLFDRYEQQAKAEATRDLASTGKLRASQLSAFLKERRGDARVAADLLSAGLAQAWWQGGNKDLPAMVRRTLNSILAEYGYTGAMILDTRGDIRFSAGRSVGLSATGKSTALRALGKASPVFSDLYFADPAAPQEFMLDTFALVTSTDGAKAVGMLVLRGDWDHLFSAFQPWPEDSRSAEYLLVRKDGADVLFLNQLRHQEQAADRLRAPLTGDVRSPAWPAIRAVQGHYGALESVDYRGKAVLAYTLPVPDTDWSMTVKQDVAEALEGIRHIEMAATFSFLVVAALAVALWWSWLCSRRNAEQALRESRERFEKAFQASPDSITLVTLDNGTFVEVNSSFERFTGYSPAEAMDRNACDLNLWMDPAQRAFMFAELHAGRTVSGLEARIRRKDGEMRVGQRFATRVEIGGVPHVLSIMRDITEQKKAEEALRASEEKFSKAFHASPDSIALSKLETGEFVEVNEGFERISGYSRGEAIGRTAIELGLWTQPDRRAALIARLASGGEVRNLETMLRRKDGAERVVLISLETIDLAGEKCMLTLGHDVTERKLIEEQFRATFEQAAVGIAHVGLKGDWLRVNSRLCDLVGYSREELLALTFQDITHSDDLEAGLQNVNWLLAGEISTYSMEKRYIHKNGGIVWANLTVSLVRSSKGEPNHFISIVEDITQRKNIEQALRASEERLNEAQRIAKVGNWELDLVGDKLNWSDGIFRIFEIDQTKFGATRAAFLNAIHPEDREAVNLAYTRSLATREPYDITHRLLMADGRIKYVHERCESDLDAEGKPIRSLGTVQDVTDLKRAEEALRQLNAELEQRVGERTTKLEAANKELETFTYSVSHDLKGPLRGIDGYSRLLLADHSDKLDGEGRQFLHNVRQAARQMGELIDDLLAYSRLERRDMRAGKVNPQELIEALLAERADEIKARGVAISLTVSCTAVTADRDGLALVLRNLLENALKFTGDAPQPMIEIGGRDTGTTCIFSVRDNGIGFDMKFHDRIFGIFERLHRSEDYPGTGVGLAIVKKAMERMGGRAWAESEPGKGATFYLEIPE